MDLLDRIEADLKKIFKNSPDRLKHILGVRDMAIELGVKLGVDEYKCALAALLHDITKKFTIEQHKEYLSDEQINKLETEVLYHAYSAAEYAKKVYDIEDNNVIIAIRSHVYGNMNMSLLDKIILVSDFCEKNRTYNYCVQTREVLLKGDFNEAFIMTLELTIKNLIERCIKPTNEQLEIYRKYGEQYGKTICY